MSWLISFQKQMIEHSNKKLSLDTLQDIFKFSDKRRTAR
jgi:hypothetical protein